jgi:ligand-binding sensor domain-containing protein
LAQQGDTLWAGGESGLVRWNLAAGDHTKLSRADGLASNGVNDLLVDGEGTLWIATRGGINRVEGGSLRTYDESDGLDSKWIQALHLDESGGIWAGSYGGERGLNFFDGQRWGLPPIPPLPLEGPNVWAMAGSKDRGLFVGLAGQGLAHFDGQEWTVSTSADGLPSDEVQDLLLTADALWASFDVALLRLDLETGDEEIVPHANIHALHQAADGRLWFGGEWRALRYDAGRDDWQEFDTSPGPIPGWKVNDIAEDENGLWFATQGGGVALYDGSRWETEAYVIDEEVGGNSIEAIRQGKDGPIWFTHPGTGLSRYEPAGDTWQVFGEAEGTVDWPCVPAIDSEGHLWTGDSGELLSHDGQGWQRFTAPELAEVGFQAIAIGPRDVRWLVTDSGLIRYDPASDEWTTFTSADHSVIEDIWSILAASDGSLWLGGEEELVRYDGSSWSTPEASGDAPHNVDDMAEAPDGSLWIAADGELGHITGDRWSYSAWPDNDYLECLDFAPDGSVWAGGEGLGRYDPGSGQWQRFGADEGLVHLKIEAIHVTPEGVVWIGTQGGISRYVPADGK